MADSRESEGPRRPTEYDHCPVGSLFVAIGIFCSRLAGLVRLRVFAHYFGLQSDAADAFNAAFRIPNFLQNLFGEGALSASFIPVYAALVARGERARGRSRRRRRGVAARAGRRGRSCCSASSRRRLLIASSRRASPARSAS